MNNFASQTGSNIVDFISSSVYAGYMEVLGLGSWDVVGAVAYGRDFSLLSFSLYIAT